MRHAEAAVRETGRRAGGVSAAPAMSAKRSLQLTNSSDVRPRGFPLCLSAVVVGDGRGGGETADDSIGVVGWRSGIPTPLRDNTDARPPPLTVTQPSSAPLEQIGGFGASLEGTSGSRGIANNDLAIAGRLF